MDARLHCIDSDRATTHNTQDSSRTKLQWDQTAQAKKKKVNRKQTDKTDNQMSKKENEDDSGTFECGGDVLVKPNSPGKADRSLPA